MAHAGITHIMSQVNKKIRGHYTLNIGKPENLLPMIKHINKLSKEQPQCMKIETYMGDIKKMYTELLHSEIKKAVDWILQLYADRFGNTIKIRKRLRTDPLTRDMNVVRGTSHVSEKQYMTITLDQLKQIVHFDLGNTFFKVGTKLYLQIKGIPMGSNLSPALAYLICEYYERRIPNRIPTSRLRFLFGARYMDDLLLIYMYAQGDEVMRQLLETDVQMITDTDREDPIYHKDLKIKPETDPRGAPCLGTLITVETAESGNQTLDIRYLNKNEITIQQPEPSQKTLRLQHIRSFTPMQQKLGIIIGGKTRIKRLTLHDEESIKQIKILSQELKLLGYQDSHLKKAICKKFNRTTDLFWHNHRKFF